MLLVLALHAAPALACAPCACGDPTLTPFGAEQVFAGRTRALVAFSTRSEFDGVAQAEERMDLAVAVAASRRFVVSGSVPLVRRTVTWPDLSRDVGFGPGDVGVKVRWVAADLDRGRSRIAVGPGLAFLSSR